jgi:hypothetical protein
MDHACAVVCRGEFDLHRLAAVGKCLDVSANRSTLPLP